MRKIVIFVCLLLAIAVPAMAAELSGGYYIEGDSAMGKGLRFYVPADFASGSLTYDSSGNLFNLTSSSIYLYCPDYPDYTIYASRFSGFQYRNSSGAGYQYQDLNLRNVAAANVEILQEDPVQLPSPSSLLVGICAAVCIVGAILIIFPRR